MIRLALLALALAGCATWAPVDAYVDPVHVACANLPDGVPSDTCHVRVTAGGLLTEAEVAEFAKLVVTEGL